MLVCWLAAIPTRPVAAAPQPFPDEEDEEPPMGDEFLDDEDQLAALQEEQWVSDLATLVFVHSVRTNFANLGVIGNDHKSSVVRVHVVLLADSDGCAPPLTSPPHLKS
eukprot:1154273-Pelagomonas_calceolata.AAC.6